MSSLSIGLDSLRKEPPEGAARLGWALVIAGAALAAAAYAADPRHAAFANVVGFLFLTSVAVGSVFLIALEYIAGAVWSVPMRRVNEFLAALVPLAALLAVPMLFRLHDLFAWMHPEALASDAVLAAKKPYLNEGFFLVRYAVIFAVWTLFAWLFARNSLKQDLTKDESRTTANIRLAGAFLPVFAVTLTFTAIDWGMSIEPRWYSTIFGVYYFSGTVLAAVAAATFIVVRLRDSGHLPGLTRDHFYSLGALLFAFINFWAYIAFSQFLLIWYANLPEETFWFMKHWQHGWQYVSVLLIVVHFAVPYFVLLPQEAKMDARRLKFMALWILFAHLLDLYWLVMPTYSEGVPLGWIELAFPVLIAGAAILMLSYKMKRHNLMPLGDPKLARGLEFRL